MASIYGKGQEPEYSQINPEGIADFIGFKDGKPVYVSGQERKSIAEFEKLIGLERGGLYPGKKYPPISFWKYLSDLWGDKQARQGMITFFVLLAEVVILLIVVYKMVWR